MKIEKIKGLDERVYQLIAPYAMNMKFVLENGNPITTSEKHTWYVGFDKDERVSCFCSVKRVNSTKSMQIGNLFVIIGGKRSFNHLVKEVIKDTKELLLKAYASNDTLPAFQKLGFEIEKEGVNWHNLKYRQ